MHSLCEVIVTKDILYFMTLSLILNFVLWSNCEKYFMHPSYMVVGTELQNRYIKGASTPQIYSTRVQTTEMPTLCAEKWL